MADMTANTAKLTVRLPDSLWRDVKVRALDERRDAQDVVADALRAYLKTPVRRKWGKR